MNEAQQGVIFLVALTFVGAFGVGLISGLLVGPEDTPKPTPLQARDIYATVHMPEGDFDSLPPSRIRIDGAMTIYDFPLRNVPFAGEIKTVGLHMNGLTTELRVNPPVMVSRGDNLTIVQPVEMMELRSSDEVTP